MTEPVEQFERGSGVLSLHIGDLHLSERPPVARSTETDWLGFQGAVLGQVKHLSAKFGRVPIFVAGDLMHYWNSTARLINWAMHTLVGLGGVPIFQCVPGQHDIPHHNYLDLGQSAYWSLVEAKKISHLTASSTPMTHEVNGAYITPFPWGWTAKPPQESHPLALSVAIIHAYIFTEKTGHQGADPKKRYGHWLPKLRGYHLAHFGDNHKGFLVKPAKKDQPIVFNAGTLFRRRTDDREHRPRVGILYVDGTFEQHFLTMPPEKWADSHTAKSLEGLESSLGMNLTGVVEELSSLRDRGYDWQRLVREYVERNKLAAGVSKVMLAAVEETPNVK